MYRNPCNRARALKAFMDIRFLAFQTVFSYIFEGLFLSSVDLNFSFQELYFYSIEKSSIAKSCPHQRFHHLLPDTVREKKSNIDHFV